NLLDGGGETERIAEMLGGHIDITATSTGGAKEYQDSGDFKVLAVLSEERDDLFPDVPTAQELGYDIIFPTTHILYGPDDLDEEVIEVWNEAIKELVENEEYQNQLEEFGGISHNYKSLEELDEFIIDNVERIEGIKDQLGY